MAALTLAALALTVLLAAGACSGAAGGDPGRSGGRTPLAPVGPATGATTTSHPRLAPAVVHAPSGTLTTADPTAHRTATPAGPLLTRVTEPGCCPLPFWSADGRAVLFWQRPPDGPSAVYGVPAEGGAVRRVAEAPSGVHLGGRFTTLRHGTDVVLTRTADGRSWRFDTSGESLTVAADGTRVAWAVSLGESVPGAPPPARVHWLATLDGADAVRVDVPPAYALSDWTADGAWLLVRVDRRRAELPALVRFQPDSGEQQPLLDGRRLRVFRVSPGRSWLALTRTNEDDAADDGLYVVATDGTVPPRRIELVGGYQWRDDGRLLVVPMEPGAPSMAVWQVDAATGQAERLTDPERTSLRIAGGEWSASPGGRHVAFRSADDDAVWVLTLP